MLEAAEEAGVTDDDTEMLMVLIYEAIVHGQRLRMGGRLPKLIKFNTDNLKEFLNGDGKAEGRVKKGA